MDTTEIVEAARKGNLILDGIPEKTYFAIPAMSSSGLKEFRKGPGYFRHAQITPNEDTDARRLGRLIHMAIGEPARFAADVIVVEGHRGRTEVKEQIAALVGAGKMVVKQDQFDAATAIAKHCRGHALISKLLKAGVAERTLVWTDPETKVLCKARIDWSTPGDILVDWKNYDVLWSDDEIERQIRKMRYQFQTAWYREGFYRCFNKQPRAFYHGFLRAEPPIDAVVVEVAQHSVEETLPIIRRMLESYAECLQKDYWPMSEPEVRTVEVRPFFD